MVLLSLFVDFFFFFQAEDGIRDDLVTGVQTCALPISGYMRKERLEPDLDHLFTKRLTNPRVLARLVKGVNQKRPAADTERLNAQLESLKGKRQRVLDYYFEGGIGREERDTRIAEIEREQKVIQNLLAKHRPN